jgi:hypothetical protein
MPRLLDHDGVLKVRAAAKARTSSMKKLLGKCEFLSLIFQPLTTLSANLVESKLQAEAEQSFLAEALSPKAIP